LSGVLELGLVCGKLEIDGEDWGMRGKEGMLEIYADWDGERAFKNGRLKKE
jgi:hypothetical protein